MTFPPDGYLEIGDYEFFRNGETILGKFFSRQDNLNFVLFKYLKSIDLENQNWVFQTDFIGEGYLFNLIVLTLACRDVIEVPISIMKKNSKIYYH